MDIKALLVITILNQNKYTQIIEKSIPNIDGLDVLFIDDHSVDDNLTFLDLKNRKYITKNKGMGLTDSWNIAYRHFVKYNYDYLFLSNNDVILNYNAIIHMIKLLNKNTLVCPLSSKHGAGHNKIFQDIGLYYPQFAQLAYDDVKHKNFIDKLNLNKTIAMPRFNGFFFGMNRNIMKSAFDNNNLFNPKNINIGQEDDLYFRLKEKPIVDLQSFIFHYKKITLSNNNRNDLEYFHKKQGDNNG